MWEIDLADQLSSFGVFLCLGAALAVVYDVLFALRSVGRAGFAATLLADLAFWVFSAFCVYSFLYVTVNGEIRGFLLIGAALGALLYRFTLSRFVRKILKKVLSFLRIPWALFCGISRRARRKILLSLKRLGQSIAKIHKKTLKKAKNA